MCLPLGYSQLAWWQTPGLGRSFSPLNWFPHVAKGSWRWAGRPMLSCAGMGGPLGPCSRVGPFPVGLVRSRQMPAGLPRSWLTRCLSWGLTCCCQFVGVLRTLVCLPLWECGLRGAWFDPKALVICWMKREWNLCGYSFPKSRAWHVFLKICPAREFWFLEERSCSIGACRKPREWRIVILLAHPRAHVHMCENMAAWGQPPCGA